MGIYKMGIFVLLNLHLIVLLEQLQLMEWFLNIALLSMEKPKTFQLFKKTIMGIQLQLTHYNAITHLSFHKVISTKQLSIKN